MTFARTEYLTWLLGIMPSASHDLSQSGTKLVAAAELDLAGETLGAIVDDFGNWTRFRAAIARANGARPAEVLPALGCSHAVFLAYAAILSAGDDVLVEAPTYEPMYRIAGGLGARVLRFERPVNERFALDPDRVARAMTPRTRLVVVTNLHNPGGVRASDDTLRATAQVAAARGAYLLVDEVYAPFDTMLDDEGRLVRSARTLAPNIVVTSSLTKVFGMGMVRLGWVAGPEAVIARAEDAMTSNVGHTPLVWSGLGALAFERLPQLARRSKTLLADKRRRVDAWMKTRPDLGWSAPEEGLYGFVTVPGEADVTARIEAGVRTEGVLVAAGKYFEVPNGFRLAWSIDEARLDDALVRLGRVFPPSARPADAPASTGAS